MCGKTFLPFRNVNTGTSDLDRNALLLSIAYGNTVDIFRDPRSQSLFNLYLATSIKYKALSEAERMIRICRAFLEDARASNIHHRLVQLSLRCWAQSRRKTTSSAWISTFFNFILLTLIFTPKLTITTTALCSLPLAMSSYNSQKDALKDEIVSQEMMTEQEFKDS